MFLFKTIDDINNYVENLKKEYNPIRVSKSQAAQNYNESTKNAKYRIPLEVKYYRIQFTCKHFGKQRNRSKGIRKNQKVLATGCNYHVEFKYERLLKGFIITSQNMIHNHETGPEIYCHYAENRKIPAEVKEQAIEMMNAGAKASLVRKIIEEKTSKVVLTKDLHNLKKLIKPKTNVEELARLGGNFLEQETNSEFTLVVGDEEFLEMLFIQTGTQKILYESFGEMLQLDAMYRVANTKTTLFDFVIEDGNGKSAVVGYCFVTDKCERTITQMLNIFKAANPSWETTKVVLIDKDFAEVNAVKSAFKDATLLLCVVNMMKSVLLKLKKLKSDMKDDLLICCKRIVRASTVEELDSYLRQLESLSDDFYKYFIENWMSIKHTWSKVYQPNIVTLMNTTTNREANHRVLKQHLSSTKSLIESVKVLIELNKTDATELSHSEFKRKMLKNVSDNRHIDVKEYFSVCTSYAAELIASEHKSSLVKTYTILRENEKIRLLTPDEVCVFEDEKFIGCSCEFSVRFGLPCRHIFYIRRILSLPSFDEELVPNRFLKSHLAGVLERLHIKLSENDSKLSENDSNTNGEQNMSGINARLLIQEKEHVPLTYCEKFGIATKLCHKIAEATAEQSNSDFEKTMKSLEIILQAIHNKDIIEISAMETDTMEYR